MGKEKEGRKGVWMGDMEGLREVEMIGYVCGIKMGI